MSTPQIAAIKHCSSTTVNRRLQEQGVSLRTISESNTTKRASSWNSGLTKLTDPRVANVAKKIKDNWDNPVIASKMMLGTARSVRRKPNKPEQRLIRVAKDNNLPIRYVGDGQVIIGRMNPDFINTNGKKEVVEVFGDYWHSEKKVRSWKETELGRIMAYKVFGFDCIIIWEHEIKTMTDDELVKKMMPVKVRQHA